jgi:hypothetical protein
MVRLDNTDAPAPPTSASSALSEGSAVALLDQDSDVDVYDTMIFLGCMSGQGIPADVYCAEP